jgi:hypothetical protein
MTKQASTNSWELVDELDVLDTGGGDPECYTRVMEARPSDPGWRTIMWFGGPGRTSSNDCDPF